MKNNEIIDDYLKDESLLKGNANNIFFCLNTTDVEQVLRNSYFNNVPITIQGALTGICGGAVPYNGDILNLSKMDKIIDLKIDKDSNFILKVQPGLLLKDLNHFLNSKKFNVSNLDSLAALNYKKFVDYASLMFPSDPTETLASLGGMVACEASGACSYMYGSIRKYIKGLKVVTPLKTLDIPRGLYKYKDLEKLLGVKIQDLPSWTKPHEGIKDVAGLYYEDDMDLIDLFIGSEGIFGVITEIDLLLINKPLKQIGLMLFLNNSSKLVEFVNWLRNNEFKKYNIAAIEYFDKSSFELLNRFRESVSAINKLPEISKDYDGGIYLEFHIDDDKQIESFFDILNQQMSTFNINQEEQWFAFENNDYEKLKSFRHAVPECVNILIANRKINDQNVHKVGTDMSTSDDLLFDTIKMYNKDISSLDIESVIFGHIGNNHLHVNLIPSTELDCEIAKIQVLKWAKNIVSNDGSVSGEHGIGKIKKDMLKIMFSKSDLDEMKKLKKILDPKSLINLGTFLD